MLMALILAAQAAMQIGGVKPPPGPLPICGPMDYVFSEDHLWIAGKLLKEGVTIAEVTEVDDPPPNKNPSPFVYFGQGRFKLKTTFVSADNLKPPPLESDYYVAWSDDGMSESTKPQVGDLYFNVSGLNFWNRGGKLACRLTVGPAAP